MLLCLLIAASLGAHTGGVSFQELPMDCRVVSADGKTVVGWSLDDIYRPCYWSRENGVRMVFKDPKMHGVAASVSADGRVIAGDVVVGSTRKLFVLRNGSSPTVTDVETLDIRVSGDGRWIASQGQVDHPPTLLFQGSDIRERLPSEFGLSCISANGSTVFGNRVVVDESKPFESGLLDWGYTYRVARWTKAGGIVEFDLPTNCETVRVVACSADGSIVCGNARTEDGAGGPFTMTKSGYWKALPELKGATRCHAFAISSDGRVVVGTASFGPNDSKAVFWRDGKEPVVLQALLEEHGVSTEGLALTYSMSVSGDGTVIVGYGFDEKERHFSWIARIPR